MLLVLRGIFLTKDFKIPSLYFKGQLFVIISFKSLMQDKDNSFELHKTSAGERHEKMFKADAIFFTVISDTVPYSKF